MVVGPPFTESAILRKQKAFAFVYHYCFEIQSMKRLTLVKGNKEEGVQQVFS